MYRCPWEKVGVSKRPLSLRHPAPVEVLEVGFEVGRFDEVGHGFLGFTDFVI
jgi:hypothetical protein